MTYRNAREEGEFGEGATVASGKRRIYLAGPMTGIEDHNYPLFRWVARDLRRNGHYVYSPHEHFEPMVYGDGKVRKAFADFAQFICLEADTIVLLPGWKDSRGARAEHSLASVCGLDVIEWVDDLFCQDELNLPPSTGAKVAS